MSKETFFFATGEDLRANLREVERSRPLKYVKCAIYSSPEDYVTYNSIDEIECLGTNISGNHHSERFLVLDSAFGIEDDAVQQNNGGVKYFIEHIKNPTSIMFLPGGFYGEECLVEGNVNTISDDPVSLDLYKHFRKGLIKGFTKIPKTRYYVSEEVLRIHEGIRLVTIDVKSPPVYDLDIGYCLYGREPKHIDDLPEGWVP